MNSPPDEAPRASEFSADLELLRQVPFFSVQPLEALKVLAYLASHEIYAENEDIFRQGDQDGKAYLLLSGSARLVRTESDGSETQLTEFSAGAFLGSLSLLTENSRLFSLRAMERLECLCLTREKFQRTLERFPDMVPKVMDAVAKSVMDWEQRFIVDHSELCGSCRTRMGVSLV